MNAGPRHRFTVAGKIVSNSYCMGPQGFARQAKVPLVEAEAFFKTFFARYPRIAPFRQEFWTAVRKTKGTFWNIFGRPRHVPQLLSGDKWERVSAERRAIASLIQGTAAELTKASLVRIHRELRQRGLQARCTLTIHDEIQIDTPVIELAEVVHMSKKTMEDYPQFAPIPVVADASYSVTNWAEKKAIKVAA